MNVIHTFSKGWGSKTFDIDRMSELYKSGWALKTVAEDAGICTTTAWKYLRNFGVALRSQTAHLTPELAGEGGKIGSAIRWRINVNPDLTPEKAYVLGVVGPGDGSISLGKKRGSVVLSVIDKDFADEFARCFKQTYGIEPTRCFRLINRGNRRPMYQVENHRRAIVADLLGYNNGDLKTFKHGGEKVPNAIREASLEVKAMYLRGFFDSQGGMSGYSILAAKANGEVLKEIQLLLLAFGIKSAIYDYTKISSKTFHIRIYAESRKLFYERIGFSIKRKQEKLKEKLGRDNPSS